MSRRSLRLEDGLLDRSLPHSAASFSAGAASWRSTRSLRSRGSQQLSASCSESLLLPRTPLKSAGPSLLNSSLHSVASDASLISSLLEESTIQESTLVDTLWGLDHDSEIKESAAPVEESSAAVKSPLSRLYCTNCEVPSSTCVSSCVSSTVQTEPREAETSKVYGGGGGRRRKRRRENVLQVVGGAIARCFELLLHTWQVFLGSKVTQEDRRAARAAPPGVMSLKEVPAETKPTGSLCGALADVLGPPFRRWSHSCGSPTRSALGLLLLLLLLLSLSWFGPPALQSVLVSDWITAPPEVDHLESSESQSEESAVPPQEEVLLLEAAETDGGEKEAAVPAAAYVEWARLFHVEQRLAALWEHVDAGGRRAQRRHDEVLHLYTALQQQRDGEGAWLNQLLDQQLLEIRKQLDDDRQQREQMRQMDLMQQQAHTSRLDQLELQLKALTANIQQVQSKQEVDTSVSKSTPTLPAAVGVGVDRQSNDALLAEVARLGAALQDVRRDVESLSGCSDGCRQLATVHQEISGQVAVHVREELRALVSGAAGGAVLSESLLQWLSQRCVTKADLQEALSSVQRRILHNVSLQLEQQQRSDHPVRNSVRNSAGGVTAEDVDQMVTDALRLFSQDRTGMADYALESGGGSIMSTRCSETYETKAALLSLFGVPLWYFSQSPRAVIQPDVHPGNCWAFRGSSGFLVIRLSMRIRPTAFSLEHIPRALAPSRQLLSAPRDFSIYGLDHEAEETGTLLGTYMYDQDGEALQTFAVTEDTDKTFQIVEVQVLSNWGHPDYTCLYRVRVHGTPAAV